MKPIVHAAQNLQGIALLCLSVAFFRFEGVKGIWDIKRKFLMTLFLCYTKISETFANTPKSIIKAGKHGHQD